MNKAGPGAGQLSDEVSVGEILAFGSFRLWPLWDETGRGCRIVEAVGVRTDAFEEFREHGAVPSRDVHEAAVVALLERRRVRIRERLPDTGDVLAEIGCGLPLCVLTLCVVPFAVRLVDIRVCDRFLADGVV